MEEKIYQEDIAQDWWNVSHADFLWWAEKIFPLMLREERRKVGKTWTKK